MANYNSTEIYIDNTFNFASVTEAVNDNIPINTTGGGLTFENQGAVKGGTPLVTGSGFFLGYDDTTGNPTFMVGNFEDDYIHLDAATQDIDIRASGLELTGALLGPSTFIIDPATHTSDLGTVQIKGSLDIGSTGASSISSTGSATFYDLVINDGSNNVASINSDGSFEGKQVSVGSNTASLSEAGVITGTQLSIPGYASISSLGAITGTGLTISGISIVDSAGDITGTTLSIGGTSIDEDGNLQIGPEDTGFYIGVDGTIDLNYSVSDLEDVTIGTLANNHVLKYNNALGKWGHSLISFSEISNRPTTIEGYGITDAFSGSYNDLTDKPSFATVATSGSYTDLTNKPTIPTVPTNVSAFTNDAGYITSVSVAPAIINNSGTPQLASGITAEEIADLIGSFTGSWNDLTDKPTSFVPTSHNQDWLTILGTPTTIEGYGITDAFDGAFSSLTGKPTTISGYGITDAFSGSWNDLTGKPQYLTDAGLVVNLNDLNDVSASSATEGDVLVTASDGTFYFAARPLAYGVDVQNYTATANQTTFNIDYGATDKVTVFVNGICIDSSNYTATSLTNIVFSQGLTAGDLVTLIGYTERDEMDVVETLSDLTDVDTSGASSGQALIYDGSSTYSFGNYSWDDLVNTPTTLAGYGITDAVNSSSISTFGASLIDDDNAAAARTTLGLATVASTGSYNDLSNRPVLATVATSGSYTDLLNKPYIPTTLDHLYDVTLSGRSDGHALLFDSNTSQWKNEYLTLGKLNNVGYWADAPEDDAPVYLRWSESDELWVPYQVEIDDIYGIPEPTSADVGRVLTVQSSTNPQTYLWRDATDLTGVADSEVGTWTARYEDTAGNTSPTSTTGTYSRVGNIVTVSLRVWNINDDNLSDSNTFRIRGLPFTSAADATGTFVANHIEDSNAGYYFSWIPSGDTRIYFPRNRYSTSYLNMTCSALRGDNATDMFLSLTYITS